jgi:hypothetical protein
MEEEPGPLDPALVGAAYLRRYALRAGIAGDTVPATIVYPRVYSFLEDPDAALDVSAGIVARVLGGAKDLPLDQRACAEAGLCAEALSAALVRKAQEDGVQARRLRPDAGACAEFVDACALANWGEGEPGEAGCVVDLLRTSQYFRSDRGAADATEAVMDRLRYTRGQRLEASFAQRLGGVLGEALDNALTYGDGDCWIASAIRRPPGSRFDEMEIVMFNFGPPLHRTLLGMAEGAPQKPDLETLLARHRDEGRFTPAWTPEELLTRHALQDGVSCVGGRSTRGAGSRTIIGFFDRLHAECAPERPPRMAIVSGRVYVCFDGTYRLRPTTSPTRNRRFDIPFNPEEDFGLPADPRSIRRLRNAFPGTLIALRFALQDAYLQSEEHA